MPKYSQNFLHAVGIAEKIARCAASHKGELTLEIGPGKGFLTAELLALINPLYAVEIDPEMVAALQTRFPPGSGLNLMRGDFLETELDSILPPGKTVRFAGNLPYAVAGPILQKILGYKDFSSAVLMFQKEVAERILAKPGGAKYGILALSVQSRAKAKLLTHVSRGCFHPVPKVDSSVVELTRLEKPFFKDAGEEAGFFRIIKAAFSHRRKTVLNSLSMGLCVDKAKAGELLAAAGISAELRPQDITPEQYLSLAGKA